MSAIQETKRKNLVNKVLTGDIQEESDFKPNIPVETYYKITREKDESNGLFNPNDPSYKSFSVADSSLTAHRKGNIILTGIDDNERKYFEARLGLPKGTLLPTNFSFWGKQRVTFKKKGKVFNVMNNDEDFLNYKWLSVHPLVAKSTKELLENPSKIFLLSSDNENLKSGNDKHTKLKNAVLLEAKMSIDEKIKFLSVFQNGKYQVKKSSTPEYIDNMMSKIVMEFTDVFISTATDKDYQYRVLLQELIGKRIIVKLGNKYIINGETEPFAMSQTEAIMYVANPENNSVIVNLKAKL